MTGSRGWKAALGIAVGTVLALSGAISAPAHAQAPALISQPQIKKMLLTLPQIQAISKVGSPMSADELTCHHAPYLKGTFVNYCYYTALVSTPAYAAGKWFPNHVDIISLASPAIAKAYLKELRSARKPETILRVTPTYEVFYDKDAPIATPAVNGKPAGSVLGPVVSVYAVKGPVAVYTACADPKATSPTALETCARALANAQLARIPAVTGP